MGSRRQFIGSGLMVTAAPLACASSGRSPQSQESTPVGLFVYEADEPDAIEAGRVMAGQGVRVLRLDLWDPASLRVELQGHWARERTRVVGLTSEAGFRQARALAKELGHRLAHSAPAHRGSLVNWIVGPAEV